MNTNRIDELMEHRNVPMQLRPEVREFARLPQDEQLVLLYMDVIDHRNGIMGHVITGLSAFALQSALITYIIMGGPLPYRVEIP